jgi:hypothetical protein
MSELARQLTFSAAFASREQWMREKRVVKYIARPGFAREED